MNTVNQPRPGSKIEGVYLILAARGKISNIEALSGEHKLPNGKRLRTSRLAAVINVLKTDYGIQTRGERINWEDGEYRDYIYHFIAPTPKQETLF